MNLKIFTVQYYSTVQVYENKNVIIEHSYVIMLLYQLSYLNNIFNKYI